MLSPQTELWFVNRAIKTPHEGTVAWENGYRNRVFISNPVCSRDHEVLLWHRRASERLLCLTKHTRTGNNTNTHTHLHPSFYSGDVWIWLLTSLVRWWIPLLPKYLTYDLVSLRDVMTIAKRFYDLRKWNVCCVCLGKCSVGMQIEWNFRQAEPFFYFFFLLWYWETISHHYLCCCNQSIEKKVLQCNWEQWPVFFLPAYPSL